ncbi:MAG TPA: ABC transporter permease [Trueperaceae bacterium]|nr:ABC transporter permease [Trueperaceae bacterium]
MTARLTKFARQRPTGLVGIVLLVGLVVASVGAPLWGLADPLESDYLSMLSPPAADHVLGTDQYGRDLLTRVIYGARLSLGIGASVMTLAALAGLVLGSLAGYFSRLDGPIMRGLDVLMAFPAILLAIAIMAILGTGARNGVIALAIVYTPRCARIVRASVLSVRQRTFVEAGQALGAGDARSLGIHILPNAIGPLVVQMIFVFAYAILADAGLSFIGVGTPPPTPSLGNILAEARDYLMVAPWLMWWPGAAIAAIVLALNLCGDALREVMDPRQRSG